MTHSERALIESEALRLGWSREQSDGTTLFARYGLVLEARWSDNHVAVQATLSRADGQLLDRKSWLNDRFGVGEWIRTVLREPVIDTTVRDASSDLAEIEALALSLLVRVRQARSIASTLGPALAAVTS